MKHPKKAVVISLAIIAAISLVSAYMYLQHSSPTLTSYEDKDLNIYECSRPVQAKPGISYNLIDGAHKGLEPADQVEFATYCTSTGIE